MNSIEVQELLEKHQALLSGHFKLTSGRHSDRYVQKQRVMEHPRIAASLASAMVTRFSDKGEPTFETVVSPAVGAIGLGTLVAYEAHRRFLFTERIDGAMALRRGQVLRPGEKVLIVEDIVTTGGSAAEVVEAVRASGAEVVGVAAIVDRSNVDLPFRLTALTRVDATDHPPEECPMCAEGLPLDAPGSRTLAG